MVSEREKTLLTAKEDGLALWRKSYRQALGPCELSGESVCAFCTVL